MPNPQRAPFGLRMPDELKEWTKRKAHEDGRSVNNLIVQILREKMAAGEGRQAQAPAAESNNAALARGASINQG